MSSTTLRPSRTELLLWLSFGVFLVCYLGNAIWASTHAPLWMDEVLSVWTIRLGSPRAIVSALVRGSEFSPPLYHLVLLYFTKIAGSSYLAYRLPSIFAGLVTGVCVLVLVRRYLGLAPALFASCLVIEAIRPYALETRPYALATACFAVALVLWDSLDQPGSATWRPLAIALLLAAAISLHFYSVLFVVCFGLLELLYEIVHQKFRVAVWIALLAAGASIFLWLPLIHAFSRFNAGDTSSALYFAHPTVSRLLNSYGDSLFHDRLDLIVFFSALALFAAAALIWARGPINRKETKTRFLPLAFLAIALLLFALHRIVRGLDDRWVLMAVIAVAAIVRFHARPRNGFGREKLKSPHNFAILVLAVAFLPVLTFVFSSFVSHTYNSRYVVPSFIAAAAAAAAFFAFDTAFTRVAPAVLLIAAVAALAHQRQMVDSLDLSTVSRYAIDNSPIVISEGRLFFALEEGSPPAIRSRLIYLTLPGEPSPDPTNEHQVERWKTINPSLPVYPAADFLAMHTHFYLWNTHTSTDVITDYLLARHRIVPVASVGSSTLYESTNN